MFMTDFFPAAVQIVLEAEGVFSDNPNDPGKETVYGIARASHPDLAPWPPTKDQAIAIYRSEYWDAHRCGEMPWAWALAIFDGEVNQGSVIKLAQTTLGLKPDGVVGNDTLTAINKASDEILNLFFTGRAIAYIANLNFANFGRGWLKRLFYMRARAAILPT